MCGIAGIYQYRDAATGRLDEHVGLRMVDALAHRGPDGGGLLVGRRILLGHRRLAILDLSERGRQPMSAGDERCWIAYNGEVYNFLELRRELEEAGQQFHSRTDTEVILRGYLQWGRAVALRLNGIFAFALWDRQDESLWLVRDPVGVKPLFYCDDGSCLRFGSEIKAILADPAVARTPDPEALDAFLTFGYIPAPQTGFRGIRQLLPGEWLVASAHGVERQRWFSLPYPDEPPRGRAEDAVECLEQTIDQAVTRQMISDVPLGAMLSGGLDSSAVVRAMSRRGPSAVETFTIRFREETFDESSYAARVAQRYGTQHRAETVAADAARLLPVMVSHAEEPFADNSMIPFFLLSEFVRQRVTVALSGDGADELLGGYDTYRASQWAPFYRRLPRGVRRAVAAGVRCLRPGHGKGAPANLLRRFIAGAEEPPLRDHCSWRRIVSRELRPRLYSERFAREAQADPVGQYAAAIADAPPWLQPLERQLHVDFRFHLPNDMLVKVDRMSMAHSLEVRVPLLDLAVVQACLALPPHWKRRGRRGKIVLRQMLAADLPPDVVERRKAGFLVPLEAWMQSAWQPFLRQHLTEQFAADSGLLHWPVLHAMIEAQAARREDYAYPLFAVLVLALWWRIWITGEMPVATLQPPAVPTIVYRLAERP